MAGDLLLHRWLCGLCLALRVEQGRRVREHGRLRPRNGNTAARVQLRRKGGRVLELGRWGGAVLRKVAAAVRSRLRAGYTVLVKRICNEREGTYTLQCLL